MVGNRSSRFNAAHPPKGQLDSLGHRLKYARACRGVSKKLAAEVLRVNPHAMSSYESGLRAVPYELVRLMAWAFDVPIDWLVEGAGEVPCQPPSPAERYFHGVMANTPEVKFRARMREAPWRKDLPRVDG